MRDLRRAGLVAAFLLAVAFVPTPAHAQAKGDVDVFFGVDYFGLKIDGLQPLTGDDKLDMLGVHADVAFYLSDMFGIVLDASFPRKTLDVRLPGPEGEIALSMDFTQATYMAGPRLRFNPAGTVSPSIQGLVGWYNGSLGKVSLEGTDSAVLLGLDQSGFAASVGANLDIRLGQSFALRLPQASLVFTGYGDGSQTSLRLSGGIVGRF